MEQNSFLYANRKVAEYHDLNASEYEPDDNDKYRRPPHIKTESENNQNSKDLIKSIQSKIISKFNLIKTYYFEIMNKNDENLRNLFFLLLFVLWLENLLCSLTVNKIIHKFRIFS